MNYANRRAQSRVELVIEHLKTRGHISEGSALVEYGRFRVSDVIHRLRNERADLVPAGQEIITIHKQDTQGNRYGEWHLVQKAAAAARALVQSQRSAAAASV